jgi:hypothetical protein
MIAEINEKNKLNQEEEEKQINNNNNQNNNNNNDIKWENEWYEEKIKKLQILQIQGYSNLCWFGLKTKDPFITIYFAKKAIGIISVLIFLLLSLTNEYENIL